MSLDYDKVVCMLVNCLKSNGTIKVNESQDGSKPCPRSKYGCPEISPQNKERVGGQHKRKKLNI